jgi:hypothetical protein
MVIHSEQALAIFIAYCIALTICVVSFGYFSLRRVPDLVATLIKGELSIGEKEMSSRIEKIEDSLKELQGKLDAK